MLNNAVKSIDVAIQDRPRSYKDKSSSTHITLDFGSVVPARFQRVYPDSEFGVGDSERVILTSLVAPCFGQLSLKSFSYFVPFSDLTRNYAAMMAQEAVARGGSTFVPLSMPFVPIRELSMFVLVGAQMTIYAFDPSTRKATLEVLPGTISTTDPVSSLPSAMQTALTDLGISFNYSSYGLSSSASINLANLLNIYQGNVSIPLGNVYPATFFDARTNHASDEIPNMDPIPLSSGYDYVVPVQVGSGSSAKHYLLSFRLSSFGRRLRKVLIGLGWQFSLTSVKPFSIMRLVAYYLAYFNLFGIVRFKNWEQTYAYKIMQVMDLLASPSIFPFKQTDSNSQLFRDFIMYELGMTYYTEELDFVSAHQRSTAISPSQSSFISSINTDVDFSNNDHPNIDATVVAPGERPSLYTPNGHAFIDGTIHGQLDSELLMRLYRQTNVNTIAGRRIAELCRAQGLGPDMEKVKCNFIGSWELDLDIYDLPNQSDTYQKVNGADVGQHLGEFGAYGKSVGKHDTVHFKASENGYYINMIVVVPKGGFCETVDPESTRLDKYGQYNDEFDSLGYQFNSKDETVLGSIVWQQTGYESVVGTTDGELTDSFGLAPTYFEKKFGRNVINGEFSLNSKKSSYSQWHLEKLLSANDHKVTELNPGASGARTFEVVRLNTPSSIPIAGDVWRYSTRYEWLARYNRIFYNSFSTFSDMSNISDSVRTAMFEYFSLRDDNFILHMRFDFSMYDKMLPVQKSFETEDDEIKANSKMKKA